MIEILKREFIYILYYFEVQLSQIFLYWIIGMAVGSFISVFAKEKIQQLFGNMRGKHLGLMGILPACLLGVASPLCMYGTIPIAASFSQKGMRDDWLGAFMMSSILLNPQLIIYSMALGPLAFTVRIVSTVACGCAAGLLLHVFYRDRSFFDFGDFCEPENHDTDPRPFIRYLKNFGRNIKATGPAFLLGVLLSALFQRYVPQDLMTGLFGGNRAWGVLMAATIGVPLYACGGGTIPLLREWLRQGMSIGSAAAFMITGPATKITNLGALKIVLGIRNFLIYLLFVMGFASMTGILIDMFV